VNISEGLPQQAKKHQGEGLRTLKGALRMCLSEYRTLINHRVTPRVTRLQRVPAMLLLASLASVAAGRVRGVTVREVRDSEHEE
jgi:hypothetical protein